MHRTWAPWAIRDPETWIAGKVLSLVLLATLRLHRNPVYQNALSFGIADASLGGVPTLGGWHPTGQKKIDIKTCPIPETPQILNTTPHAVGRWKFQAGTMIP